MRSVRRTPDTHVSAAKLRQAETALGLGRLEVARGEAESALRIDPIHVGALELLAKVLWQQGEYGGILEAIDRLTRQNPYEPGYFALRGAALQALGRYGDAIEAYSRCAQLSVDPPRSVTMALAELHAWQQAMLREMLRDDAVFRAEFARNAEEACRHRGFRLVAEGPKAVRPVLEGHEMAALGVRPS
jgi:tetratricopeptide (TPR) repeat protein